MPYSIDFQQVTKIYRRGAAQMGLRGLLTHSIQRILPGRNHQPDDRQYLYALKDASFGVSPGEALGLIGHNGAGKTTALKLISRVTQPSSGKIETQGRITSLIELGAGFHPELTGRENIYLNGAIMGLSRKEISQRFDPIVDFAEIDDFLDTPVKRYSSGMYARLGFAVAANIDPDILLVDEVLAVGDSNFQRKCLDFIHNFVTSGHTTVFVSHNLFALEQLCDRIIWLDHGQVVQEGPAYEVLASYMRAQDEKLAQVQVAGNGSSDWLTIKKAYLTNAQQATSQVFRSGEDIQVNLEYGTPHPIDKPHFVLAVWDGATRQSIFIASMLVDGQTPQEISGAGTITCTFKAPPLMPRAYQVWGEVYGADRKSILYKWQPLAGFTILAEDNREMLPGSLRHERSDAPVRVAYTWKWL
jgi:lipopolysaccharide transport system ATP-binding protein